MSSKPNFRLAKGKSGYWEIRWSERDEAAGRSRSRSQSCGTKSKREAEHFLSVWVQQRTLIENTLTDVTVGHVIDEYVRLHVQQNCGSETNDYSLRAPRRWFGDRDVSELGDDEFAAYLEARLVDVKSATVRKELSALRAALNWAAHPKRRLIDAADVPLIELPADSAPRRRFLDYDDAELLFAEARRRAVSTARDMYFPRRRIGLFVCIALETAARESAIRGLTWDRVDLKNGLIDYRDPAIQVTNKRRVPVPISDKLLPVLQDAWARRGEADDAQLVLGHTGAVHGTFKRICEDVGLTDVNVHDLRRTWASLRAMWGVPLDEIAAILGDTVDVTERHYAHLRPGYGRNAVNMGPPGLAAAQ